MCRTFFLAHKIKVCGFFSDFSDNLGYQTGVIIFLFVCRIGSSAQDTSSQGYFICIL